ncbi:sphinganine kinase lcb4 [Lobosporangium transversale]|uniref:ATP-NAD kinase-like domain-containing protein n=1 Tax=Lobosporangium transversale TaxID=64571 RepID=A0A1Y2GTV6_9FUNG|nr:ATP-NAD kinase-like domain-containing protein [Lobosporangium transversale]KAF9914692.1 sphinganine kinase lcb4 [Lobosporangium transversale]ORZ23679.1 ATP-NAD kinase-like domain-containing protein [Lobosporangium transversale]|eukprot:XP_021883493.1 ATP-NAD kinase-like domain-containing protein [Lobosporangium transversale]
MASFPLLLSAHLGDFQVQLAYNGQVLQFDLPEVEVSKQQAGCLPCGPTASSGFRVFKTVEILNISISQEHSLVIAACAPKHGVDKESVLEIFTFNVKDLALTSQWRTDVLNHVYKGIKKGRHFKILVNPFGGQGHAKRIWEHTAEPLFKAAGCTYDLTYTTHRYHAKEIARDLDIRAYDAIVSVSGDGVIHEVINGLMERPDAIIAHKLPLGAVPGGSGNALSFSLLGEKHGAHVANAVLNIVKGKAMPVDLCSVTQGDSSRFFSFELQSFGLIADVDLGSEHLRWMGEARFTFSAVGKLLSQATYPCELAYIPAENNIKKIQEQYNEYRNQPVIWADQTHDELDQDHRTIIDRYGRVSDPLKENDGWVVEKDHYATVVGAKLPWISKGSVSHPAAQPNDGLIDLLIFPKDLGRMAGVQIMIGVETGVHVFHEKVRYLKVKAFRLSPQNQSGYISMDGEHTPYAPYQVEAHRGLVSVLSIEGRYARSMSGGSK